jgi:penicillin-binding protein 2
VRIKDHWREQRLFETRALFAGAFIVLLTLTLLARLYMLQIVQYDYYTQLSQGNRVRTEPIPAARGFIYDRNGEQIAGNTPAYQLELVPELVPDIKQTLKALADLQLIRPEDIDELLRTIRARRSFDSVPLRVRMSDEEVARFAVHRFEFRGVDINTRQTRWYPNNGLAVHALGYVSSISEQDLDHIDRAAYTGTALIGKLGVESAFEPQLHGVNGWREVLVNAQGRSVDKGAFVPELKTQAPVAGDDVILSIDLKVQRTAEEALSGHRGAVVALDPNNGEIIALVSLPDFNPNWFARGITGPEYRGLQGDADQPLFNRAIRGTYPPGSTVKPVLALAALTYHAVDPEHKHICTGAFYLPGYPHPFHDYHNEKHGAVDLDRAIVISCDNYFYSLAQILGVDRISRFMAPFGFGKLTGIDISGEKSGILPSREWKAKAFRRPADQIWFPGETVNFGVGQGYLTVTPLQLAHYASVIASRGKIWRPQLVTGFRDARGELHPIPHRYDGEVPGVSPDDWARVVGDMVGVVQRGTAAAIGKAPYVFGGKTGTAQVFSVATNDKYDAKKLDERLRDHSWFIAFAPADNPRIAVAVLQENGEAGARAAAPIARKVLDSYLLTPDGKLKLGPNDLDPQADAQAKKSPDPAAAAETAPGARPAEAPAPANAELHSTRETAPAPARLAHQRS